MGHTKGIVVVGHDVCEGIRDISTCDNFLGFSRLIRKL